MNFSKKLSFLLILASVTLQSCVSQNKSRLLNDEVIYKSDNGNNIEIYNLHSMESSPGSSKYLKSKDPKFLVGEFISSLKLCSDENFFCIDGGIFIALPKHISTLTKWSYNGYECNLISSMLEFKLIECKTKNNLITQFVYSQRKGVISYKISWMLNDVYELIGDNGLFSSEYRTLEPE